MIFLSIYGTHFPLLNHSAVRDGYENPKKQVTSGVWRKKVKLASFKPIVDHAHATTLKKLDHISTTIIYMIYAIQLATGSWTEKE